MTTKKIAFSIPKTRVRLKGLANTSPARSAGARFHGFADFAKSMWGPYPSVAATFSVGANRGHQPANRQGFCAKEPRVYSQKEMDLRLKALRVLSLMERGATSSSAKKTFAASRVEQKGWYRGKPERSAAYTIFFDPNVPGEEDVPKFVASMRRLAEMTSASLCQDEVILTIDTPEGKKAEGLTYDRQHREIARGLFGKGRRGR